MSNKTIADCDTPDPWIISSNNLFYFTFTLANRVEIWASPHLEDFRNCQKTTIWQPEPNSPWSADVWAPELHRIGGKWYVYTCGAPPDTGNAGHRTLVLESEKEDPMDASGWTFLGPLKGMSDHWSIDATVFSISGDDLYCCWSGWPPGDTSDTQQDLFLAKMANPTQVQAETTICICHASKAWERADEGARGVAEGPTWVDFAGFRGIVYSAHGSWTSEYKLGLIALDGNDPLRAKSWSKRAAPLLVSDKSHGGPFGPGHASFLPSPHSDGRIYCIYHGTSEYGQGWDNRKARVMSLGPEAFAADAEPVCCHCGGCLKFSNTKDRVEQVMNKVKKFL
ncbi:hypothetical protein CDD80_7190 [Ophiocordyceps camponoti-rufipedis]|uniref:Alpha-L-arabinofuranosidase II n=1 Tax=Ophiocordyceps camponoti-rufipedis TaxID=2004952 RepID=A0A2C5ZDY1_9HYPO|nr:hypothetical protein CDD80_7190 [Ophiocordyceps camponoti-rufipedis]